MWMYVCEWWLSVRVNGDENIIIKFRCCSFWDFHLMVEAFTFSQHFNWSTKTHSHTSLYFLTHTHIHTPISIHITDYCLWMWKLWNGKMFILLRNMAGPVISEWLIGFSWGQQMAEEDEPETRGNVSVFC